MSRTLQLKRYANTVVATTTGAPGELIIDNTNHILTIHDGLTPGGYPIGSTDNVARTLANSAIRQANIAIILAQTAFNQSNAQALVEASLSFTTAAYGQANIASAIANTVSGNTNYLQGGLNTANANISYIIGVNAWQNTVDQIQNANMVSVQALANTDYTTLIVSAGVYGNSTNIPVITLTANGRVSSITNTTIGGSFTGALATGNTLTSNNGLYVTNNFTGTYADGIVVDYVSGIGRISVGPSDQITFYTGGPNTTPIVNLYSNGTITTTNVSTSGLITTTGNGIGYATGSGGTIAQITSRVTGVTLNKPSGQITLFSQAMANNTSNTFVLTNSTISANDFLMINHWSGGTLGNYHFASNTSAGQANVTIRSFSTVATESPILQYVIIKGAAS